MSKHSPSQNIVVSQNRKKCIGCNYCVEFSPERWRMSKKDGKATLIGAVEKKGFYTARTGEEEYDNLLKGANACPVNIIQVKKL